MKAKRGDIAVIVTHVSGFVIGEGSRQHDEVTVCEVTSITREGVVKAVRKANWGLTSAPVEMRRWGRVHTLYVVPQTDVNVPAALAEAAKHPCPHNGMPGKYYDTLDEVRSMLRAHVTATADAASRQG